MGDRPSFRVEMSLLAAALAVVALATSYHLESIPAPWWDEGWTLSVARNWVVSGHYGHMLDGQPAAPVLSAHLPVVALIAAAFSAFGVGLLQARAVMVACALITLLLLYMLSRALAGRRIASIASLLVCLAPVQWDLSLVFMGRQVLGEIPSLLFILAGLLALTRSGGSRWWPSVLAGVLFGLALATKAQVVPFVATGLVTTTGILFFRKRDQAWRMALVSALAFAVPPVLSFLRSSLLTTPGVRHDPVAGLVEVTALVLDPDIRMETLRFAFVTALPVTLGLLLAAVRLFQQWRDRAVWTGTVRMLLLLIAGSWYAWYVLLSIGWGRYVFPPAFLAAPFIAELVAALWERARVSGSHGTRYPALMRGAAVVLLVVFAATTGRQVLLGFRDLQTVRSAPGLNELAAYVNTRTPVDATVETYESELLFLLDRPVHVPPAQLNVDFIRKNWLGDSSALGYSLGGVRADLLVVGAFGGGLYDPLIREGVYTPRARFGAYTLHERSTAPR